MKQEKREILVAGYGFVGKAVFKALREFNQCSIIDPLYNSSKMEDYPLADGVVICVGTPSLEDGGCDDSQIRDVISKTSPNTPILIKSTVTPDNLEKLVTDFPDNPICYSPEFLRARSAEFDFTNQRFTILGGDDPDSFWETILSEALPLSKIFFKCTLTEASTIKYAANSFLATKVAFFNHMFDLCNANGADFNVVRQILVHDHRIGSSHTLVPGIDEDRGFGGHCFPKDTKALIKYSDQLGVSLDVLKSAIEYNKTVRKTLDL
jgi:UDPglucose 6-dehydrogenase